MKKLLKGACAFIRDEEGLTMVEYAVAGALILGIAVGAFRALGTAVGTGVGQLVETVDIDG